MLPSRHRLRGSRDFQSLYRRGRTIRGTTLRLRMKKTMRDHTRIGFVVSNKVAKRATDRNRLKRQLREAVRPFIPRLVPGQDVIVTASSESLNRSFSQLQSEVRTLFSRVRLLPSKTK